MTMTLDTPVKGQTAFAAAVRFRVLHNGEEVPRTGIVWFGHDDDGAFYGNPSDAERIVSTLPTGEGLVPGSVEMID
jgi:hypothetical protein